MKATTFDGISRNLSAISTRRSVFRLLGGAAAVGALAAVGLSEESQAKKKAAKITICYQGQTRQAPKRGWQNRFPGATRGACSAGSDTGGTGTGGSSTGGGDNSAIYAAFGCTVGVPYDTRCPYSTNPNDYCWVGIAGTPLCGTAVKCFACTADADCVQFTGKANARCAVVPPEGGCLAQNSRSCIVVP
jgi:hypothetical protein